ncbi:hypothetical protein [Mechercharimyces sp. CAU 1602]|uniref:hypothetical protein n=1 Tax=Mechercharimyces sp. CAU 1602 TaxID=2973933 RepID=UPI002161EB56|nr:hypothetical protein [Mechercharimyces sp. CAU 1602]MCS1350997.1 hypothetical protein [Mechercharimyces sp. CAU 1602]
MYGNAKSYIIEMGIVIVLILLISQWFIPFLIWLWFSSSDFAATMLEWFTLVTGVCTYLIYLGLGSSAKQLYRLSTGQALFLFCSFHFPVLLPNITPFSFFSDAWCTLIGEWPKLFYPHISTTEPPLAFLIASLLFLSGRTFKLKEEDTAKPHQRKKIQQQNVFK